MHFNVYDIEGDGLPSETVVDVEYVAGNGCQWTSVKYYNGERYECRNTYYDSGECERIERAISAEIERQHGRKPTKFRWSML